MWNLIGFLIIGGVAGWLAGQVMRDGGMGVVKNVLVGVVGAFIGGFVFSILGISAGGVVGSLVTATVGAILLLFIAGKVASK
ncbi:MAG: GlsB/YeaQ/YmgE family stress response membrane protein [Rhodothermales bacterium]|nr:GlsB/YeaQ/YmgE family stress response membrane protein [Rhodothermales bacterium]